MKNVNGLANAMRLVESACEKGEITIIGEGGMPTPVELYKKCVAYINKQYGVDILNLVLKEQKPCECNGSCTTIIVDTEADEDEEVIVVALGKVEDIAEKIIRDKMGYLNEDLIENILEEIKSYYANIDGESAEDYDTNSVIYGVCDAFSDCLDLSGFDTDYIDDIISKIVNEIDEKCILVEQIRKREEQSSLSLFI